MTDEYANRFLDEVAVEVQRLGDEPALALPRILRPVVRRTLLAIRPDGSWPEPFLLQEALRAYVDLVDIALAEGPDPAGHAICGISEPGGEHSQSANGKSAIAH